VIVSLVIRTREGLGYGAALGTTLAKRYGRTASRQIAFDAGTHRRRSAACVMYYLPTTSTTKLPGKIGARGLGLASVGAGLSPN